MISVISLALAAICNAVMDKTTHHFHKSIFSNLNEEYWNPKYSWQNKYVNYTLDESNGITPRRKKILGIDVHPSFTDSWHLFKSLMIGFIGISIITYEPIKWHWGFDLAIYYLTWNLTFSLFYNTIFARNVK